MPTTHDYEHDKRNESIYIYVNGEFFHRHEAKVSVMDSGYLLGDGVWEGIRLHNRYLVHLKDHIDRLFQGAKAIKMDIGLSSEEIIAEIWRTLDKNEMQTDAHIRLIVSRGIKKTPYQHPKVTIAEPTIVIIPEYKIASPDVSNNGIRLGTVETIRDNRIQDPRINSLSKHNCIAACIEADAMGVDEGLMLDPNGNVATCNSTNFFIVRNNEVWTSKGEYCLNGITRGSIIRLCKINGIAIMEKDFQLDDVYSSEEVFVTGTFAGIIPVISVDGTIIGKGVRGNITKELQHHYNSEIERLASKR